CHPPSRRNCSISAFRSNESMGFSKGPGVRTAAERAACLGLLLIFSPPRMSSFRDSCYRDAAPSGGSGFHIHSAREENVVFEVYMLVKVCLEFSESFVQGLEGGAGVV